MPSPIPNADTIFAAPSNLLLVQNEDVIVLFDPTRKSVLGSADAMRTRFAVWSADGRRVALVSKNGVRLLDRNMSVLATATEQVHVKGYVPVEFVLVLLWFALVWLWLWLGFLVPGAACVSWLMS